MGCKGEGRILARGKLWDLNGLAIKLLLVI